MHALIGFWDFPVSTMVPMLCQRLGLRWASLESVRQMRAQVLEPARAARVIDEYPRFGLVDLDDDPTLPDGLRYPVWLKPVKSASSALAFRVPTTEQLAEAAADDPGRHRTDGRPVRVRARPAATCRPS